MQLVNVLLSIGLLVIIYGITVLSICAVIASSRNNEHEENLSSRNSKLKRRQLHDRRQETDVTFPLTCSDGSKVFFDRRINSDRRMSLTSLTMNA